MVARFTYWRLGIKSLLILLLVFTLVFPYRANAQIRDCSEKRLRDLGVTVINCTGDTQQSSCSVSPQTSSPSGASNIYMIGDSITEGSLAQLQRAFTDSGITAVIDGKSSRRLSEGNTNLDGITVLKSSSQSYVNADAVVIALGTNGYVTELNITKAIESVKIANNEAVIYWVNLGVVNEYISTPINADDYNKILQDNTGLGYEIIDWSSEVSNNPSYIDPDPTTGLGVHPINEGKTAFADLIAGSVRASGSSCSTTLSGEDNAEKVWNYMISKGLTPFQVAGFMGNMQAEAGFEPRLVEYGLLNSRGEISVPGEPSSLDDEIPPNQFPNGRPGYGIVQWTAPGRKDGLRAFSESRALSPGDLGLQLDYVWEEINGACCGLKDSFRARYGDVTVLEALKQTQTVEDATDLILRNYEIPANIDAAYVKRIGFAIDILTRYGS